MKKIIIRYKIRNEIKINKIDMSFVFNKREEVFTSQAIGSKKSHIAIAELKLINPLHQEIHSWNKPRSIFFSALPTSIQRLIAAPLLLKL